MTRVLAALRALLHHHWPENPTCRSGIVYEVCRCGHARYVRLWNGRELCRISPWTDDPEARADDLARYVHEGIAR